MKKKHCAAIGLAALAVAAAIVASKLTPRPTMFQSPLEYGIYMPVAMKHYMPPIPWKGVGKAASGDTLRGMPSVAWHYSWQPWKGWGMQGWIPLVKASDADSSAELQQLAILAGQHPGTTWLVFNEPDLASQDGKTPAQAALLYRDAYDAINGADPTAKLYCCGTAFSNTSWLEQFRWRMTRPMDGIHFHGYPCINSNSQACENDPGLYSFPYRYDMALAASKMNTFYAYCQGKSQFAGKPIWLTEFGILSIIAPGYEPSYEYVRDNLMYPFLGYLEAGGLGKFQRVAWFSDRYGPLDASDLTYPDNSLTALGASWDGAGQ